MTTGISESELDRLAGKLADELATKTRAQWIDSQTHTEHHQHVGKLIQRESDIMELRRRIIYSACIWAVPLIIAWAASSFWRSIVHAIQQAGK